MKIHLAFLELLHADGQTRQKSQANLKLLTVNISKTTFTVSESLSDKNFIQT